MQTVHLLYVIVLQVISIDICTEVDIVKKNVGLSLLWREWMHDMIFCFLHLSDYGRKKRS